MKFTKMHGLGNQYIFVNQFEEKLREEELVALSIEVSDVFTGIGSDGMILIGPSTVADLQMRIFNKDGSEAKNCGNGLRCVAKYAYDNDLVNKLSMTIETLGGIVEASVEVNEETNTVTRVTVDMGVPRLEPKEIPLLGTEKTPVIKEGIEVDNARHEMTAVSMGNPHAVFFVNSIENAPLTTLGPKIEKHPRFPDSVNVEFVQQVSTREMHFRVWERGSGITQACGTGACAAVVAAVLNGFSKKGEEVLVHLAGGDLHITWDKDDRVWMTGPAETICIGEYVRKKNRV
ncbi:diaminopimelate epimerase [Evansella cellulosilytica]|uniref:Diaminopimelate epimerase n=1 Tax=Evansella cellulosilytica (strain ATCC 21833 / DSM 2522 / FERM P-1141 / JCM 9156 / N-4) TaxID=649639 RepID=E6U2D5_EVAC2|nr:diaminopimelate epimerase [Evansella cellulosilytica]ADU31648.1 diaminopimelate epimerase [Evansella cellulosilytica DSM 2522]